MDRETSYECLNLRAEVGSRRKAQRLVLDGVSFEVGAGEFVSIMGRSGVGKTTLLRILAGLHEPSGDSVVRFGGEAVAGPPEGVSIVFQDYASSLLPWRSVGRNVELPLEGRLSKADRQVRVAEALEMVGLADRSDSQPFELSGGMQQRVQLARALVSRPAALLMDEPFGALDALTKAELEDQLLAIFAATGTTVVFVTHDIEEAVYLSDRVLVLDGTPAQIVAEIPVESPRPRTQMHTRESAEFLRARHRVHEVIFGKG
jgi:NitT/TauT family transport system ATP-binding protein